MKIWPINTLFMVNFKCNRSNLASSWKQLCKEPCHLGGLMSKTAVVNMVRSGVRFPRSARRPTRNTAGVAWDTDRVPVGSARGLGTLNAVSGFNYSVFFVLLL